MRTHLSIIMASVLLSTSLKGFAATKGVQIDVSLYPVGSFTVNSDQIEGKLTITNGTVTGSELKVPITSLKTGISLRDDHMYERMKHTKHPYVLITDINGKDGKGNANINVGGIASPVSFTYKPQTEAFVEVSFPLDLTNYKIEDINYKGIGVEDEVSIKATIPVEKK